MEESGNFSSQTYTNDKLELSTKQKITCIVLYVILMVLIVVGNGLLLFVIIKAKELKRSSRIFLVSLTVADLFVGLVVIPVRVVPLIIGISIGSWNAPARLCEASYFLEAFAISASVLALLALTIERYLAVEMPLRFRSIMTYRRVFVVVACSWLMSLCSATVLIILSVVYEDQLIVFDRSSSLCTINGLNWVTRFTFLGFSIVYFLIPTCATGLASIRILYIIKNHTAFHEQTTHPPSCNCGCEKISTVSKSRKVPQRICHGVCQGLCKCFLANKKALVTVLIVTLSYSASSVPFAVCFLYMIFSSGNVHQFLVELAKLLLFTSCFTNVIVYTIRHRAFMASAKRLLCVLLPERRIVRQPLGSQSTTAPTQDSFL